MVIMLQLDKAVAVRRRDYGGADSPALIFLGRFQELFGGKYRSGMARGGADFHCRHGAHPEEAVYVAHFKERSASDSWEEV